MQTEMNPLCANCHRIVVAEEGYTCASIPASQRWDTTYCDQGETEMQTEISTLDTVIAEAQQAGYTHVTTSGGLVPLTEWAPYGKREGHHVAFYLEGDTIQERDPRASGTPAAFGIWKLERAPAPTLPQESKGHLCYSCYDTGTNHYGYYCSECDAGRAKFVARHATEPDPEVRAHMHTQVRETMYPDALDNLPTPLCARCPRPEPQLPEPSKGHLCWLISDTGTIREAYIREDGDLWLAPSSNVIECGPHGGYRFGRWEAPKHMASSALATLMDVYRQHGGQVILPALPLTPDPAPSTCPPPWEARIDAYHVWQDVQTDATSRPRGRSYVREAPISDTLAAAERLVDDYNSKLRIDGIRYYVRGHDERCCQETSDAPDELAPCWIDAPFTHAQREAARRGCCANCGHDVAWHVECEPGYAPCAYDEETDHACSCEDWESREAAQAADEQEQPESADAFLARMTAEMDSIMLECRAHILNHDTPDEAAQRADEAELERLADVARVTLEIAQQRADEETANGITDGQAHRNLAAVVAAQALARRGWPPISGGSGEPERSEVFIGRTTDGTRVWARIELTTPRPGGSHERNGVGIELHITHRALWKGCRSSGSYGAGADLFRQVRTFAPGWNRRRASQLADYADRWHLNALRSACEHQRARGETWATHPSAECPECGYRLGHGWLYEPLPQEVIDWARDLGAVPHPGLN